MDSKTRTTPSGESKGKVYYFDKAHADTFIRAPGNDYRTKNLKRVPAQICGKTAKCDLIATGIAPGG
ncbi:hypothetical protein ACWEWD_38505 [Streptomyces tendae]